MPECLLREFLHDMDDDLSESLENEIRRMANARDELREDCQELVGGQSLGNALDQNISRCEERVFDIPGLEDG